MFQVSSRKTFNQTFTRIRRRKKKKRRKLKLFSFFFFFEGVIKEGFTTPEQ